MARKIIPYPCDYKVLASVKRARRAGNIFVLLLCIVVALLIGAGVYFAVANDYQALKTLDQAANSYGFIRIQPNTPQFDPNGMPPDAPRQDAEAQKPDNAPEMIIPEPQQPTAAPQTTEPSAVPNATKEPVVTPPPFTITPKASPDPDYEKRLAQPINDTGTFENLPDIVDAVYPGVVGIVNQQYQTGSLKLKTAGTGSGFILTTDGYIVTNQHVVEGAHALLVTFADGAVVDAELIGSDVQTDVAVLKIDTDRELTPLVLGDSDTLRVGEFVLAIGNPISSEELYGSVTFGIISAKARQINIDGFTNEYVQTDAAVNPGNSGGPLINMNGEVVGVTSAKYVTAGYDEYGNAISSEGIGFALPINNVMQIVDAMIKTGNIARPGIGISIATRSEEEAQQTNQPAGVYVYSVTEGGPTAQAGLQVGDVIVAIEGKSLERDAYVELIRSKTIGEQIVFTILRNGETLDIPVTVGDLNLLH